MHFRKIDEKEKDQKTQKTQKTKKKAQKTFLFSFLSTLFTTKKTFFILAFVVV